jgi:CubicO group peptidase (beta-lactamase class C family)
VSLAALEHALATEAADGALATGGQLYVSVDNVSVLDLAVGVDGVDRPVDPDTLFAIYCAGKPALAVALATLVDAGELSFDDQVGHIVDRPLPASQASLRVDTLLTHTAGLHRIDARIYLASSTRQREALLRGSQPPPGWSIGEDVAYSEFAAWHLLALVVESLTGETARDVVRRRVLEPAGVGSDMFVCGMSDAEFDDQRERLGINIYLDGPSTDPILAERTRRLRCISSPTFGNTATARGLGRFYEALLRSYRDGGGPLPSHTLRSLTSRHSHGFDQVLGRRCGYGYGFMVRLEEHLFGRRCSPQAFGHSGYGGMTAAFCDPAHGLVVAYHLNGRVDAESAIGFRRPALVEHIYRSVIDVDLPDPTRPND